MTKSHDYYYYIFFFFFQFQIFFIQKPCYIITLCRPGGIHKIEDIWDDNTIFFRVLPKYSSLYDRRNWISEYSRIKKAIPQELIRMLKSELVELNAKANLPFRIKNSYYKNKKILENSKLRLKEIQGYFVANCVPICHNKWDTHFDTQMR